MPGAGGAPGAVDSGRPARVVPVRTLVSNAARRGDPEANRLLAEARAQAAVEYLVKAGVSPNRLRAEGGEPSGSRTVSVLVGRPAFWPCRGAAAGDRSGSDPPVQSGSDSPVQADDNGSYGASVPLLPSTDQTALWNAISEPYDRDGGRLHMPRRHPRRRGADG